MVAFRDIFKYLKISPNTQKTYLEISPNDLEISPNGSIKGLFTPKTRVFSAAEILLRIYQNPIHLNGTHWRTTFWRQREVRRRKKS